MYKSIVNICLRVFIMLLICSIGIFFSYQSFISQHKNELLLYKINIDQKIQAVHTQIKLLSQSLIIKNALRFNVKDVLKSTATYTLEESKDIDYLLFSSDIEHFSVTYSQSNYVETMANDIIFNQEIIDAGVTIGSIRAAVGIKNLTHLPLTHIKATTNASGLAPVFQICSQNKILFSKEYYCHSFAKAYLIKRIGTHSLIYIAALLLCAFMLFYFYSYLIRKWAHAVKEAEFTKSELNKTSSKLEVYEQFAHDIKSPVTALTILSSTNSLDDKTTPLLHQSVQRIKEILTTTDKNRLQETQPKQEINLESLLNEILAEKQIAFRSNHIKIEYKSNLTSPSIVFIDPVEMKRILSNILNNAAEATTTNPLIQIQLSRSKTHIQLVISDNGKGIPSSLLQKILTKGFSYQKENGSGLGLFHAKEILATWNAALLITSKERQGTRVIIQVPIHYSQQKA